MWDLEHPGFSAVDKAMPYETVFRESIVNKDFWDAELRDKAIAEKLEGNTEAHKGHENMVAPAAAETGKRKFQEMPSDQSRTQGDPKKTRTRGAQPAKRGTCDEYNAGRCQQHGACPRGFLHKCGVCGEGGHPGSACPTKNKWKPQDKDRGNGKGKGKDKGKGKKNAKGWQAG